MLKIYVARHGQNEDNANFILNGHRDLPLTQLGKSQALELAQGIKKAGLVFDAVYSSPLCRAYATAEIICNHAGLALPKVEPELIERHFGLMTGKPVKDIEVLCPPEHILKTSTVTYFLEAPEAEDYPTAFNRAERVLSRVRTKHQDGSVLLVAHSDIGKMLHAAHHGIPWREVLSLFHFGNSELLLLGQDSSPEETHVIRIEQHNH